MTLFDMIDSMSPVGFICTLVFCAFLATWALGGLEKFLNRNDRK